MYPQITVQVFTNMKTGIGTIGTTRLHLHLFLLKYFCQRIEMTNLSPFGHLKPCFLLTVNINRTESVCREFGTIGLIIDFTLFCIRMVQYQSFMGSCYQQPRTFYFIYSNHFILYRQFPKTKDFILQRIAPYPSSV